MVKDQKEFREYVGKQVVDIAFHLHKALGPGLLESVYQKCFCYELTKRKLAFVTERKVSIVYDNIEFEEGLRLDLLVEDMVIVELKAQENYHPVWEAQLLSYLKLTNKELGYLINFTVPLIKDGIKRMVLSL
jgi:GxxExxY protein